MLDRTRSERRIGRLGSFVYGRYPVRPPTPCLLCGAAEFDAMYEDEPRDVVTCRACGFTYVHPMPADGHFRDVYESDYWTTYNVSVGEPDIHNRIDEFLTISDERVGFLKRFKSRGRFLDVGCSMGFLVKAAQDAGFEAVGLDLSEEILAEGRVRFGVDLRCGTLEDYPLERFDAIATYNTIEHLVAPDRMMAEMARRLAPEGVIVVGTHDIECETHRREGQAWKHIMPTEHLYYFRRQDLVDLGARHGLRAIWSVKPIDNSIVVYFQHAHFQHAAG